MVINMQISINNEIFNLENASLNFRNHAWGESLYLFFELKEYPYLTFTMDILRLHDEQYFKFSFPSIEHRIKTDPKVSKKKCPFCDGVITYKDVNCIYLYKYIPDIIKQLLELPHLRLRALKAKGKIDYDTFYDFNKR